MLGAPSTPPVGGGRMVVIPSQDSYEGERANAGSARLQPGLFHDELGPAFVEGGSLLESSAVKDGCAQRAWDWRWLRAGARLEPGGPLGLRRLFSMLRRRFCAFLRFAENAPGSPLRCLYARTI